MYQLRRKRSRGCSCGRRNRLLPGNRGNRGIWDRSISKHTAQYSIQGLNRDDSDLKDLLMDIGTEELSHLEVIGEIA
jgi:Manganese containing catalase